MTLAETTCGAIAGLDAGRHLSFRGVPFARPPLGELRFRAPQPPELWREPRDAREFAPAAPQPEPGLEARGLPPRWSEDCLYLNVTTPGLDGARRPVLVWIHGGGFSAGSGAAPSVYGGPLTERGDVVVVTINYRLGAFGYLCLGDLGDANVGQLDQVAALAWVRDNAARLGGDPDNVTVFGESAGAAAVAALLAMPDAKGLFRRAIIQSGTANTAPGIANQELVRAGLLKALGLGRAAELRDVPAQRLVAAQAEALEEANKLSESRGGPRAGRYLPWVDPRNLPHNPLEAVAGGSSAGVELIVGANRDESRLFTGGLPERALDDATLARLVGRALPRHDRARAATLIEAYRRSRGGNQEVLAAIVGDAGFRIPGLRLAKAQAAHQASTRQYLFCFASRVAPAFGACHALEIPFVFGNLTAPGLVGRLLQGSDAERRTSRDMMDAWLGFARDGEPGHRSIGEWRTYDAARHATLVFDAESRCVDDPFADERRAWGE